MKRAISQHDERAEDMEQVRREALEAWNHYQETGLHVTSREAYRWLDQLEQGIFVEPPQGHK